MCADAALTPHPGTLIECYIGLRRYSPRREFQVCYERRVADMSHAIEADCEN